MLCYDGNIAKRARQWSGDRVRGCCGCTAARQMAAPLRSAFARLDRSRPGREGATRRTCRCGCGVGERWRRRNPADRVARRSTPVVSAWARSGGGGGGGGVVCGHAGRSGCELCRSPQPVHAAGGGVGGGGEVVVELRDMTPVDGRQRKEITRTVGEMWEEMGERVAELQRARRWRALARSRQGPAPATPQLIDSVYYSITSARWAFFFDILYCGQQLIPPRCECWRHKICHGTGYPGDVALVRKRRKLLRPYRLEIAAVLLVAR
ncbi:hypothetical protein KC361_g219 [Hortaea werneckii]|nr:hypothetical protein KC361_g219 [Hortaea werneckii]